MNFDISHGVIADSAQKVLIYGVEGIGKSTFASQFPDPLFIDTEGSTNNMNVKRLPAPNSWQMIVKEVQHVRDTPGICSTLVIDTIDWAERLCITEVCNEKQKSSIEDFGYGSGYTLVYEKFGNLLNLLTDLVERKINVVLLAHSMIRKFEQPDEEAAYDRYQLKLIDTPKKSIANMVKEWADAVIFANYKTIVEKTDSGKAKARGNKRVMYLQHHACWDAKNRWGLPPELPFEYKQIAQFITGTNKSAQEPAQEPTQPIQDVKATPTAPSSSDLPDFWAPAEQLMKADGITLDEIRKIAADRGHFTLDTPPENFPPDYITGFIVPSWNQIKEIVEANRIEVPFN